MLTKESIKRKVLNGLHGYVYINRFFRQLILERIENPRPTENVLIAGILSKNKDLLSPFDYLLGEFENDNRTIEIILSKLNGKSKRFDDQIMDWGAELGGYRYLKNNGFKNIRFEEEKPNTSNPDLSAEKNCQKYIVEVKNQRDTSHIGTQLLIKEESFMALNPILAKDIRFSFEHDGYDGNILFKQDYHKLKGLYRIFHDMIKSKGVDFKYYYRLLDPQGKTINRKIFITKNMGKNYASSKRFRPGQPIDNKFKLKTIRPYFESILSKTINAYGQIVNCGLHYDKALILVDVAMNDDIVLCIEEFDFIENILDEFIKRYNDKFGVVILRPNVSRA